MDSAYEIYDLGCAAAIDEMVSLGGDISLKMSIFERKKKDSRMQTKKQYHCHRRWSGSLIIYHPRLHRWCRHRHHYSFSSVQKAQLVPASLINMTQGGRHIIYLRDSNQPTMNPGQLERYARRFAMLTPQWTLL
jgi:hypothetical protein